MAEAIRIITALYDQGLLGKAEGAEYFPDLLAFQGVFHNNPDYALWYGWSEMVRDLTAIRRMAADLGLVLD